MLLKMLLTHTCTKNFSFLTCQILNKIMKFSDKSLSKIPLEIWTKLERNPVVKKNIKIQSNNTFRKKTNKKQQQQKKENKKKTK